LKDQDLDGRLAGEGVWNGFNWLRVGASSGLL
jgi:hypothetical protein